MTTKTTRDRFGPPKNTPEEAAQAGLIGWNLRCNSCGGYGATWIPGMRPGWGALALCYPHEKALQAMQRRHAEELKALTAVHFEQDR
ncbi:MULTISPECIES: hypothetical protein [Streptomyces]|uniref:Uncharacterized protein n=1 Tax=Streptomyces wuyuanensis TaxID=1196353 RepID=A0A1G9ZBN3_9ACTN|nr:MULTISPECIES: hypothetical protein [Streptomyces]MDI9887330.1 hypothetical protein [Streptomyces sp. HNM0645]SDN18724.1 hypothetical protein SAMN05444921_12170 [Streptomyces wuyuanensis]